MGRGVGKNITLQFLLIISLVKMNKSLCYVTRGGEGVGKMSPNVTQGEGGLKTMEKCHILYEWPLRYHWVSNIKYFLD
jgi:hypothetical protein